MVIRWVPFKSGIVQRKTNGILSLKMASNSSWEMFL